MTLKNDSQGYQLWADLQMPWEWWNEKATLIQALFPHTFFTSDSRAVWNLHLC